MKRILLAAICIGLLAGLSGCGKDSGQETKAPAPKKSVEVIDLDKVLKVLTETMDEMDLERIAGASDSELAALGEDSSKTGKQTLSPPMRIDEASEQKFLKKFADNLNRGKLVSEPIGVAMLPDGSIQGFTDKNKNMKKEGSDKDLFKIQIDHQRGRIVASDTVHNYHRDHHYGHPFGGFFSGYLLGRMMSQQHSAGVDTSRLSSMPMSPKGYHDGAVKKVQQAAAPPRPGSPQVKAPTPGRPATPPGAPPKTPAPSARTRAGAKSTFGGK